MLDEIALVVPILRGVPEEPVSVALGDRSSVRLPASRVLRIALALGADEFVVVHNHHGPTPPGPSDRAVTKRIVAASVTVGVPMLAHLILTPAGWYDCLDSTVTLHSWADARAA